MIHFNDTIHFKVPLDYTLVFVSLVGAVLSAVFERGRPRRETLILVFVFLLTGVLQLASAHQSDNSFGVLQKAVDDTHTVVQREGPIIVKEQGDVQALRASFANLAEFVGSLGPHAPSSVNVAVTVPTAAANTTVRVIYYPKKVDPTGITVALVMAGFTHVNIGQPSVRTEPSNAVFYGGRVAAGAIRSAAFAMLHAGVALRGIRPFVSDACVEPKAQTLEIGYSEAATQHPELTPTEINSQEFVRCQIIANR
jgi:hypothetical protein